MQIFYVDPLSKAWGRMKKALFDPFDIRKWFVMGFTLFLAGLTSGGVPSGGYRLGRERARIPEIENLPQRVLDWLHAHPIWLAVILAAIVLVIIIIVILTWVSSRGSFMFLDNVVRNRALVVEPWYKFRSLGNSLFLWRIGFGLLCLLITLPLLVLALVALLPAFRGRLGPDTVLELLGIGGVWLLITLVAAYISMFTNNFVVPLMYKYELRVLDAWKKFIPVLMGDLIYFVFYGLFLLLLFIVLGFAIVIGGCVTCCLGFVLLAVPYIGSVVLLPAAFLFRDFSLEFLAQWGPEYSVFATVETAADSPTAPPPQAPEQL
jgi:hypothetical protein